MYSPVCQLCEEMFSIDEIPVTSRLLIEWLRVRNRGDSAYSYVNAVGHQSLWNEQLVTQDVTSQYSVYTVVFITIKLCCASRAGVVVIL